MHILYVHASDILYTCHTYKYHMHATDMYCMYDYTASQLQGTYRVSPLNEDTRQNPRRHVVFIKSSQMRIIITCLRRQGSTLGLTAILVSQFFSREFCRKWDSLLAKISVPVSWVSRVSQEGENAIYCQACESRNLWVSHLRDSQTSKVIIHNN